MNRGQRTIAKLLAIIAALLAANLVVNLPPQEAKAQPHLTAAAPHVIQVEVGSINVSVFRLWSDGVIEEALFDGHDPYSCVPTGTPGFGWQVIPETVPLPHGVRITRIYGGVHLTDHLLRLRSDGVVERNDLFNGSWCGWRTPPE